MCCETKRRQQHCESELWQMLLPNGLLSDSSNATKAYVQQIRVSSAQICMMTDNDQVHLQPTGRQMCLLSLSISPSSYNVEHGGKGERRRTHCSQRHLAGLNGRFRCHCWLVLRLKQLMDCLWYCLEGPDLDLWHVFY